MTEAQRDIHQHATEDLSEAGLEGIHLSFYLTSIYDHSIFEVSSLTPGPQPSLPPSLSLTHTHTPGLQPSGPEAYSTTANTREPSQHPHFSEFSHLHTITSTPHPLTPQNSGIEKAFLFDVVSKIYIATDSSPVDMQSYELCCDMIDVVIDVSCIYGLVH